MVPEKPIGKSPTAWRSIRAIIMASPINFLLVCIPVSWALHFAVPNNDTIIFVFSFLAIIPLAKLLAFATDELSIRVGQTLAGLMNATLGNAVELIVAIIALTKCEITIVQSSLVGSILSNLLLVLGMCFFAGGMRFSEQGFGTSAVQLNSSLLTISVIAVLLPGAFHLALQNLPSYASSQPQYQEGAVDADILKTSHGVAIILLFIYMSYLVFQLLSHKELYDDDNTSEIQASKKYDPKQFDAVKMKNIRGRIRGKKSVASNIMGESMVTSPHAENTVMAEQQEAALEQGDANSNKSEAVEPEMSVAVSIGLLIFVTVVVAVTAEFLVDSINGLTETGAISKEFVGVILLPIVGNAAEHVTAVSVSVKDKLMLSLGVAVGSSIQIALFVIPFTVTLGWILGKPLTLLFDPLESIVLFLSVLTVNYTVADGKSNWLEGMILMCLYLILAVTFWFYPGAPPIFENC